MEALKKVNGWLMHKDMPVALIENGRITDILAEKHLPIYLKNYTDLESWLKTREVDPHRTNSRLLKKYLRLAQGAETDSKCFENGVLPPLPEEDKDAYSFRALCEAADTETWTILIEEEIAGGAVVKDISTDKKEVALFFVSSQIQGKGYGQKALKMIEENYPEVKTWRLVTPTQVLRNVVFYINKCGYSIVRVDDWDKEKECGMFVFEKKCGGHRND